MNRKNRKLLFYCLLFILALQAFAITRRFARASAYEKIAVNLWDKQPMPALAFFNAAAASNPWHIHYIERELHALFTALSSFDRDSAKKATRIALATADYQVKLHPNDAAAHDLRALALKSIWLVFEARTLKEAQREMNEASSLSPTSEAYVKDAIFIAQDVGDLHSVITKARQLKQLSDLKK